MKKIKTALAILLAALAIISLSACSGTSYKDGEYSAQLSEFSQNGWKDIVEITIKDGKIAKINWDAVYKDDSIPLQKKQYSKSGLYGMLAAGSIAEWYDQAVAAEQYVLKNGIDSLKLDADGYTDAIAGCTIHINELETLIRECLKQAKQ